MKTRVALAVLILAGLAGCSAPPTDGRNVQNEALALRYVDAMFKGDITSMTELLDEKFMQVGPAAKDSLTRPAMLVSWKQSWDRDYSSLSYDRYAMLSKTVTEGRVAGEWVLDWGKLTMEFKNGNPSVTIWHHMAIRIKDGKINRIRVFFDTGDLLTQQGFIFQPAPDTVKK